MEADKFSFAQARAWLNRAVTLNHDYGDHWALLYKFELQHGDADKVKAVEKRCIDAEPTHGILWPTVAKSRTSSVGVSSQSKILNCLKTVASLLQDGH